jgi:hypothetical protein
LQWFLKCFSGVFASILDVCLSVSFVFFCMLQLDVSKVNQVLHMRCAWEAAGGTDDVWGNMGDIRGDAGPLLVCFLISPTHYALIYSFCAVASGG